MTTPETREPEVIVYTAAPGSWLAFKRRDGLDDALDLSKPLRVVTFSDYEKLRAERDAAVRERGEADEALAACQAQAGGEIRSLAAKLAAAEAVLSAADEYEKWMGKWHDYTISCGDKPAKQQRNLIIAARAYRALTHTEGTHDA